MWRFSCEETVYFPFIFWLLMAIKGRAPPRRSWETKGCCAAAGTASWDRKRIWGREPSWAPPCKRAGLERGGFFCSLGLQGVSQCFLDVAAPACSKRVVETGPCANPKLAGRVLAAARGAGESGLGRGWCVGETPQTLLLFRVSGGEIKPDSYKAPVRYILR